MNSALVKSLVIAFATGAAALAFAAPALAHDHLYYLDGVAVDSGTYWAYHHSHHYVYVQPSSHGYVYYNGAYANVYRDYGSTYVHAYPGVSVFVGPYGGVSVNIGY